MSRYGLEIRAAASGDAPGLAELLGAGGLAATPSALARRLAALAEAPASVLLAVEWGPPTGVVVAHWLPTLQADAPAAWLSLLLVSPDDRRRGVGRALLKAVSQSARQAGCDSLRVKAGAANPTLDAFCLATGFAREGGALVRPLRKRA